MDVSQLPPFEVTSDGIWTWFTMPQAVQIGSRIYAGSVSSDGRVRAHRISANTGVTETFDLSGVLEVDDHDNASVLELADGRIAFFYGQHNDNQFRYRIWDGSGVFTSSGSWTAESARGTDQGAYSYCKPVIFPGDTTAGRVWLFNRRLEGATRPLTYRTSATLTGTSDPWSAYLDVFSETGARPYVVMKQDGDVLHFAASSAHPSESTYQTIRHFKAVQSGGSLSWQDSAGSSMSVPFVVADTTRADDGGDKKRWVSDVGVGSDGHPRILWMKYPNNDGTAIEYWHSRWTGSAWTAHKITDDGAGLYAGEPYYHGGLKFHGSDVTKVFLSAPISGVRQIQEWRTADNGATWSQYRAITTGGTAGTPLKFRPVGIEGGDGRVSVLWCEGSYTTYTNYSTSIRASG